MTKDSPKRYPLMARILPSALTMNVPWINRLAVDWFDWRGSEELATFSDAATIAALIRALKHKDQCVRGGAARALVKIKDASAVPALIEAMGNEDWHAASSALSAIEDPPGVCAIVQVLKHKDPNLRSKAVRGLRMYGSLYGTTEIRSAAPALIEALKDEHEEIRCHVAYALGEIRDTSAMPALIEALNDTNRDVRSAAALSLGRFKDRSAVPILIKALEDDDSDVRHWAARSLGWIKDKSAVPFLVTALKTDEHAKVRSRAALALGNIGDQSVVAALIQAMEEENSLGAEENSQLRCSLIRALGTFYNESAASDSPADRSAVPVLVKALSDRESAVRLHAVRVLEMIGGDDVVSAFIAAQGSNYGDVRRLSADALANIWGSVKTGHRQEWGLSH